MRNIDKVTVTKGAVFDYEEIVCMKELDKISVKESVERLIGETDESKEELRLRYRDESSGKDLMLFVRRGYKFGPMQMWILEGICEESDYDERMETNGIIKEWLEVEIE